MNADIVLGTDRERHLSETQNSNIQQSKVATLDYQASFKRIPGRSYKAILMLQWDENAPHPKTLDVALPRIGDKRLYRQCLPCQIVGTSSLNRSLRFYDVPGLISSRPDVLDALLVGYNTFKNH